MLYKSMDGIDTHYNMKSSGIHKTALMDSPIMWFSFLFVAWLDYRAQLNFEADINLATAPAAAIQYQHFLCNQDTILSCHRLISPRQTCSLYLFAYYFGQ